MKTPAFDTHSALRSARSWPALVREMEESDPFTERHLHCIWFDASLRPERLYTASGEEVRILIPGRWNLESGPDFLDGEWSVGGRRVRGDIEIHVRPMDWRHHGHHQDPRYRNVRLHVTFEPGELPEGLLPSCCEEISLREALGSRTGMYLTQVETSAYPWDVTGSGSGSGLRAYLETLSEEDRARMLETAGMERFRRKTLRMARTIRSVGSDQALYQTLMRGLGYKGNAETMMALARALPIDRLNAASKGSSLRALALLLGSANLLPSDTDSAPGLEGLSLRTLWDMWWPHQDHFSERRIHSDQWSLDHCRPGNHPARRLRAAAIWFTRPETLEQRWLPTRDEDERSWVKRCMRNLKNQDKASNGSTGSWVGAPRAAALLINAVLPWRMAVSSIPPDESLWSHLPSEPMNSVTRRTAHALFGPDCHPRLFRGSLRRQGLFQFHEDFGL